MTSSFATPSRSSPLRLQHLTNALRRRVALVVAVTVAGTLLVGAATLLMRPSYTAVAELVLSSAADRSLGDPKPATPPDDAAIDTQVAMLTSDAQLCRLLQALPSRPEFGVGQAVRESGTVDRAIRALRAGLASVGSFAAKLLPRREAMPVQADQCGWPAGGPGPHLAAVQAGLKVFQQRHSMVIAVSFTGKDPLQPAAIVNEIVRNQVEQQRETQRRRGSEVVAWLDHQLEGVTAERDAADSAVRQYRLTNGADPASEEQLRPLLEAKRQLALAQANYDRRAALLDRVRALQRNGAEQDVALALGIPVGQAALGTAIEDARRKLEGDTQFSLLQSQAIRAEVESMQRIFAPQPTAQPSLASLETRAAALARLAEDLQHKRNEGVEMRDLAEGQASVFTLARTPLRPSLVPPGLLLLAGAFAFFTFGSVLALTLDQLDPSFRSEHDVRAELGAACVGLVPEMSRVPGTFHGHAVLKDMRPSYHQAIRSVLVSVFELARPQREPKIVLVTSSVPGEGKSILGVSLGLCAAQIGLRTLLVDLSTAPSGMAGNRRCAAEWVASPTLASRGTADLITSMPELGYDYLCGSEVGVDLLGFLISASGHQLFQQLRLRYDCIIVDGLAVLGNPETRILASLADEVLLAIRWGETRRNVVRYAVELFRASGLADELGPSRFKTVLTRADLRAHARYRYGDAAELLMTFDRRARGRRQLLPASGRPRGFGAPWRVAARLFAALSASSGARRHGVLGAEGARTPRSDPAAHG